MRLKIITMLVIHRQVIQIIYMQGQTNVDWCSLVEHPKITINLANKVLFRVHLLLFLNK